ncbi:hypothetical protein L228DRAFT_268706 [Xylona heveae TC161]|uniref:F-box domain-containing protein n=1 Tax=Xylona heveae (strain CBS 132557 / TC161) TaxID=1328760 RepID=A0A165GIL8_XYLHT|nr:hypothetical protein L228DRAFT_268706 [Xylona heveae TC161]KZF22229.1 hypothetical protein L228DRAFT_268706 [Xylona heveae TC161]
MSSSLSSCSFDFHSNYSDVPRASSENSTTTTSSLPSRPISGHSAILASSSSSSSCLFLEILPLEVRFIIYSYLVTPTFSSSSSHPQSTLNHRARKGNQHTALASRPSHICRPFSTLPLISSASHNFWPAILRVNRQINIEARSIIYSLITWSLAPIGYQFSFLGGGVLTGLAGDIHSHHRHHFDHYLYHEQQQPRLQSSAGESYYSDGPNVSSNQNQLGTYNHPRSENFSPRFYHSPHLERGPFPELFSQGTADTSSSSLVLLRLSEPYRAGLFRHVKLRIQLDGVVLRADPTFSLRRYCDEVRRNVERVVRVVRGAQGLRTVTVEWVDGTGSEECHVDYTQTEEEFKLGL